MKKTLIMLVPLIMVAGGCDDASTSSPAPEKKPEIRYYAMDG